MQTKNNQYKYNKITNLKSQREVKLLPSSFHLILHLYKWVFMWNFVATVRSARKTIK